MGIVLAAAPSSAADRDGSFAVDGVGNLACAPLAELRAQPPDQSASARQAVASWVDGFLTAANGLVVGAFDHTPWQSAEVIAAKLAGYCRDNADMAIAMAAAGLLASLGEDRLRATEELVSPRVSGRAVFVSPSTLEAVRAALRGEGDGPGAGSTGSFDPDFSEALLAFQQARDLPRSGLPDAPTLVRLLG